MNLNLYTLARRAKNDENAADAAKYYAEIRIEDPHSWEAAFYGVYYTAANCRIGQIESAANSVTRNFKYTALEAERDDFSLSNDKLGSKSLIKLLQLKMDEQAKLEVEAEYAKFFETIKEVSQMEQVINWQENTEVKRAKDFFNKINVLPHISLGIKQITIKLKTLFTLH